METKLSTPLYPNAKSQMSLEEGLEFQDFCRPLLAARGINATYYTSKAYQMLHGESVYGIEIKLDNRCTETKRLSIEIAEKSKASNADYVASGIFRKDNTWLYVQGNKEKIFVFGKQFLQMLYIHKKYLEAPPLPTLKRYYMPFEDAEKYALLVITPTPEAGVKNQDKAA